MRCVKEIIEDITTGWNLGNSFDAFTYSSDQSEGETKWGNPKTSMEMIAAIADAGLNLLRIPITWFEEIGPAPEYVINPLRLARIKEVIDDAISNNMYVIINMHHENSWIKPLEQYYEDIEDKFLRIWIQIANYFNEYDEKLLFEALNEPRIDGGVDEWQGATREVRIVINKLQAAFVKEVRKTGGNNVKRGLLITTAGASASDIAVEELKIPEDENIIVSIHPYLPHNFCYQYKDGSDISVWDGTENYKIDQVFDKLGQVFISKNIPVILTEYGAVNKEYLDDNGDRHTNEDEVIKWVQYFLNKANHYGIKCVWWDNNYYSSGDEYFGLFNRSDCSWYRPKLKDAIIAATQASK